MHAERARLTGDAHQRGRWHKWGPYLADRAWATVREDYSSNGDAWAFLPHDLARSKAYRWGEDGIAGFCDRYQILCWSLALWNERDPILKERYFGVVPSEGNHGEDVKECYFYVDALPSHAYQRMVYKYPQRAFPYAQLVEENRRRGTQDPEFELIDTGIFDEGRYFDIVVDIAKETEDIVLFRITAYNRGPDRAPLHLIPHLWFRNTWAWDGAQATTPIIRATQQGLLADDCTAPPLPGLLADTRLGAHHLELPSDAQLLFSDNETNSERVFGPGNTSRSRYTKDAFHRYIINGERDAVNPEQAGTKACGWQRVEIDPGESHVMHMRLTPETDHRPLASDIDQIILERRKEADEFYTAIHPEKATHEERGIQRQAFAGLLWSKQSYLFDVDMWLEGDDPNRPPPSNRQAGRNRHWRHLNSKRILSMPDKWEYPWFAAWDLAFHAVVLALIDARFAKEQLWLMLFEQFQHPNGQIPAYEWEFSDLNPPVHAWAVWRVYNMDRIRNGADRDFLEKCFHKLMLNFTWWVNKVDSEGNNVFEGGFLGLDNIAVFDRSEKLPGGASLEQSDATGWMGMFCLIMMRISLELAKENSVYEGLATKFFEHYVYIGAAMKMIRGDQTLWDEQDGFFYDLLRFPDGSAVPFRVRSLVGLIPLYAIERLEEKWIKPFDIFRENLSWFLKHRREIVDRCVTTVHCDGDDTHVLAVVDQDQLKSLLMRAIDTEEFLSPFGMRSLSKVHQRNPFKFGDAEVRYEPAESIERLKGGNSNWRGPVWFPTNFLLIETLRKLEKAFGGSLRVTATTASGDRPVEMLTLSGLASRLADRLIKLFMPDADGYRPIYGPRGTRKAELFARDPHWKDLILYYEYFNGDTGEGLGASHQTGWTALVASLIDEWRN
ncbi:MAG: glucosidase [Acidobacteriota bacterium]|nr:glucosidase [Acidobacteriota bacterium]